MACAPVKLRIRVCSNDDLPRNSIILPPRNLSCCTCVAVETHFARSTSRGLQKYIYTYPLHEQGREKEDSSFIQIRHDGQLIRVFFSFLRTLVDDGRIFFCFFDVPLNKYYYVRFSLFKIPSCIML